MRGLVTRYNVDRANQYRRVTRRRRIAYGRSAAQRDQLYGWHIGDAYVQALLHE